MSFILSFPFGYNMNTNFSLNAVSVAIYGERYPPSAVVSNAGDITIGNALKINSFGATIYIYALLRYYIQNRLHLIFTRTRENFCD